MNDPLQEIRLRQRSRRQWHRKNWGALAAFPLRLLASVKGVLAALIVLGSCYMAFANLGDPAIHYAYDYRVALGHERYKTKCRYISFNGMHERAATNGGCAWIVLASKGSD